MLLWRSTWLRPLGQILLGLLALFLCLIGFAVLHFLLTLPSVDKLAQFERGRTTRIYSQEGYLIATLFAEKRSPISLKQVSPWVKAAMIAIEDHRFKQHRGVDWWAAARAFLANTWQGEIDQGASTLTMQLARLRYLSQDLSYRRKLREIVLARRIEARYSKEQILELYLNNVYFGSGAYGISTASQLYFGHAPSRLTLAQSALLAGLVQAPSRLSPLVDPKAARARMQVVLQSMRQLKLISEAQEQRALKEPMRFRGGLASVEPLLKVPYFSTYAIAQLSSQLPEQSLYRGGLEITTTVDIRLQRLAEQELNATMAELGPYYNAQSAALVLIENKSGAIRAMVGGRGWHQRDQFNRAWQALRQPGSSFKPFVYAAALLDGYSAGSWVEDRPISYGNWCPQNADGSYLGTISLAQGLIGSRNAVSVRLCDQIGPASVAHLAQQLGIREKLQCNLSLALGSSEVTPLSMASAYSSLARAGKYCPPRAIAKVIANDGRHLEAPAEVPTRVLLPEVSSELVEIMMGVVNHGTGQGAALPGVQVAGKTGTTDQSRDAWFVGFTPEYTLAVWVGNDDHSRMWDVYGGGLPATLWRRVMHHTLGRSKKTQFPFLGLRRTRPQGRSHAGSGVPYYQGSPSFQPSQASQASSSSRGQRAVEEDLSEDQDPRRPPPLETWEAVEPTPVAPEPPPQAQPEFEPAPAAEEVAPPPPPSEGEAPASEQEEAPQ